MAKPSDIDSYISQFPADVQAILREVREQFPLDEPMPLKLIERIVKLRVKQDSAKAAARRKKAPTSRKTRASQ